MWISPRPSRMPLLILALAALASAPALAQEWPAPVSPSFISGGTLLGTRDADGLYRFKSTDGRRINLGALRITAGAHDFHVFMDRFGSTHTLSADGVVRPFFSPAHRLVGSWIRTELDQPEYVIHLDKSKTALSRSFKLIVFHLDARLFRGEDQYAHILVRDDGQALPVYIGPHDLGRYREGIKIADQFLTFDAMDGFTTVDTEKFSVYLSEPVASDADLWLELDQASAHLMEMSDFSGRKRELTIPARLQARYDSIKNESPDSRERQAYSLFFRSRNERLERDWANLKLFKTTPYKLPPGLEPDGELLSGKHQELRERILPYFHLALAHPDLPELPFLQLQAYMPLEWPPVIDALLRDEYYASTFVTANHGRPLRIVTLEERNFRPGTKGFERELAVVNEMLHEEGVFLIFGREDTGYRLQYWPQGRTLNFERRVIPPPPPYDPEDGDAPCGDALT